MRSLIGQITYKQIWQAVIKPGIAAIIRVGQRFAAPDAIVVSDRAQPALRAVPVAAPYPVHDGDRQSFVDPAQGQLAPRIITADIMLKQRMLSLVREQASIGVQIPKGIVRGGG